MQRPRRVKVSRSATLPAPVKGWYVGQNITESPPGTARVLDNCFPQYDYIRVRRGSTSYATGMLSSVGTLLPYTSSVATKLFAASGTAVYDVSAGGAVGAAVVSSTGTSDWYYTQFTTSGGSYLVACNGSITPKLYDGSTWTDFAGTGGPTLSNLIYPFQFKSRLYFIEKNTLNVWYMPVDSIGGAMNKLALGGVFGRGGSISAGISWAISSNSGLYETFSVVTDQGQVAMYDGDYPGGSFTLKGVYQISRPLGRNCLMKAGGDVAVMTEDGIIPLSSVMSLDQIALQNQAVTLPIAPAWRDAVSARLGMTGWSVTVWPLESMAIINLPQLNTNDKQQFIANARSGAWARYTGWDAKCFAVWGNNLYYGTSDGKVFTAENGGQDNGAIYTAVCQWSFTELGAKSLRKQVRLIRPIIQTNLSIDPDYQILSDYDSTLDPAPSAAVTTTTTGFQWDVALHGWDQDVWGAQSALRRDAHWEAATGFGTAISPVMQLSVSTTNSPDVRLTEIALVFEPGEVMG